MTASHQPINLPALPYQPRNPQSTPPGIAVIGCGGIARHHLQAYQAAGYSVLALCDLDKDRAVMLRDKFAPEALATDDATAAIAAPGVEIADITTHPEHRVTLIEQALQAGKHVLSQKPFVLDLEVGERLAKLADANNVLLAVNQNGRWAPHFSYLRNAVAAGLVGELHAAHFAVHWDHSWTEGTPFEEIRHLILYDYAIHWFDMLTCVMADREPRRVYASFTRSATQPTKAALLAQVAIEYDGAQATLVFDGHSPAGTHGTTVLVGSNGLLRTEGGDDNDEHQVTLTTKAGDFSPRLEGKWFDDGFHGTMGELMCAIEEKRQPSHSARNNLKSLALCFAAIESAETHQPVVPGTITKLPSHG